MRYVLMIGESEVGQLERAINLMAAASRDVKLEIVEVSVHSDYPKKALVTVEVSEVEDLYHLGRIFGR